jgi:hypothetical protein
MCIGAIAPVVYSDFSPYTTQGPSKHSKKASLQTEITCLYAHVIPDNDAWANDEDLTIDEGKPDNDTWANDEDLTKDEGKPSIDSRDQNWKNTPHLKSIKPVGQNVPTESNGPHLIETIQQFEDGLTQNDSQQEESKTSTQVADGRSRNNYQEEYQQDNPTHEFVQWHYKCRHPQWVAKSGILPPCWTTCRVPQCVACYNDKAPRRPWKEKGSNKVATATSPGQIVSVDQIKSMVPGQFRDFEGFACSLNVRVLHNHDDKNQIKWEKRAQPVSYLASLLKHTSSVALVLDPYNHTFDDLFETVSLSRLNFQAHQSSWQHLCHFGKGKTESSKKAFQPPRDTNMSIIPIPLPPGDTSNINGDKAIASEGADQGSEHGHTIPMASEIVVGRKSRHTRRQTQRFAKSQQQLAEGVISYFTTHEAVDPKLYQEDWLLKELEADTVLVKSIPNPDTLYLHEAMCAPDVAQFKEALKKEGPSIQGRDIGRSFKEQKFPATQRYCWQFGL